MAAWIVHRLPVKLSTVIPWPFTAGRHRAVVTLAIVKLMIDMAVEMIRAVVPGAGADEDTATEPLGPIIAIRSAIVRRSLVIPVWANRCYSDVDCNLCIRFISGSEQKTCGNCHQGERS